MPYTVEDIKKIIQLNLGAGRVQIELNDEHFRRGVDAALKTMARWYPQHGYQMLGVVAGGYKTKVTAKNCIGILDAAFFTSQIRFEEAPYYTRWVDRSLEQMDMKDTQRVFNDTPDWHWQYEDNPDTGDNEVWFYYTFTRSSFVDTFARIPNVACVQFAWAIELSNDAKVGVNRIPHDMRQWIEDYATAKCRLILADIRNKFAGMPGADDGSILPNDGGQMVERAEAKIRELEDDLKSRRRQMALSPV